jgi:drug/metabolite transporter (DMT)-like permease
VNVDFSAPLIVYALSLVPAVLWGFAPILSKRGMSNGGAPLQAALVVVFVDSVLYLLALVFVQGGVPFTDLTTEALGVFLVAGLVGTALGRLSTFAGVQRVGASVNSAGISVRPLFATIMAVTLLGEQASLFTVGGVLVLVAGLAVLALARGGDISGWESWELLFPVAAAALFAVGNVLRRYGLQLTETTALEAVALNEMAALVVLGAYALARNRRDVLAAPKKSYAFFAGSGTLTAIALFSLFTALSHPEGRVVIVDPLTASAPLFTAVFSYFLLKDLERVTRGVVVGAALIVVGAALVTVA